MRAPGWRCGRTRSSDRPCSERSVASGKRPAETRRRQAEGRRSRDDDHLGGRNSARQAAGRCRSGTGRPRRARRPACRGWRGPPRPTGRTGSARASPRRGSGLPPGQDAARRRTRSRLPRRACARPGLSPSTPSSPMPTIASHGRSATVCGMVASGDAKATRPHSRRHDRGAAARRASRRPAGRQRHRVARRPHRGDRRPERARPGSAASAAPTALPPISQSERIDALDRRDPPLRRHHIGECRRGCESSRTSRSSPCGGRPGRRSPATAGPSRRHGRRGRGARAELRGGSSLPSAARRSAPSSARRSISISCAASIRSSRRRLCRTRPTSSPAGRSPNAGDRALLDRARHRHRRRPGTAAAPPPTARSPPRARSAFASSWSRRPPLPEAATVETVAGAIDWLDHVATRSAKRGV